MTGRRYLGPEGKNSREGHGGSKYGPELVLASFASWRILQAPECHLAPAFAIASPVLADRPSPAVCNLCPLVRDATARLRRAIVRTVKKPGYWNHRALQAFCAIPSN
jgi:hypothetical protein